MPLAPRLRIGCDAGSQPLKSPMTLTCSAFGAHTAKCTPGCAVDLAPMRAELLVGAMQRAFVEQMQIEFGEHASVLHFHGSLGDEHRMYRPRAPARSCRSTSSIEI